jgi:hypothetical protein
MITLHASSGLLVSGGAARGARMSVSPSNARTSMSALWVAELKAAGADKVFKETAVVPRPTARSFARPSRALDRAMS